MGVGPALPWKRASGETVKRQLSPPAIGAVVAAALGLIAGARNPYAVLAFGFGGFALVANIREFVTGVRARMRARGEAPLEALGSLIGANRRRYGGYVAHIGVVAVAVAITASSTFKTEHEATLEKGESMQVSGMELQLAEVWGRREPQRDVVGVTVVLRKDGRELGRLDPRMNFYPTSDQPVPTPAVRSRPWGDVYVNLQAFTPNGSNATLRVIVEPLVPWIWIGGLIICCGALVSMAPSRRRVAAAELAPETTEPPLGAREPVAAT
jgi:cytochrome c-type biogenesis protein CcmF